jgi:hypothetical protein
VTTDGSVTAGDGGETSGDAETTTSGGEGDGDGDGDTGSTGDGDGDAHIVFASAWTGPGDFGGLGFADEQCADEAAAAGLAGEYVAWLSSEAKDATERVVPAVGPYVLPNGQPAASTFADLLAGALIYPIAVHADATPVTSSVAWTGTNLDGSAAANTCEGWAVSAALGMAGSTAAITGAWTADDPNAQCSWQGHLYCVQQG